GAHQSPMVVGLAAIIGERGHSSDANGDVGDAAAPGTPKRVRDHHTYIHASPLGKCVAESRSRGIRIAWQETDCLPAGDVGGINPSVGADESMVCLRDDEAASHADNAHALAQHHLDIARVLAPLTFNP